MKRTYRAGEWTVEATTEHHHGSPRYRWVRIYHKSLREVASSGASTLLLGVASGRGSLSSLMKEARMDMAKRLRDYQQQAKAVDAAVDKLNKEVRPSIMRGFA